MHSHPALRAQKPPVRKYNIAIPIDGEVIETAVEPAEAAPVPIEVPIYEIEYEEEVEPNTINFGSDSILEELVINRLPDITAIVVNYQTRSLVETAVCSFRKLYPGVSLIIVDNFSTDGSRGWILSKKDEHTRVILNRSNKGHGPALHQAILRATTKYVFTFDSDTEFLRPGLLERMLYKIEDAYAIGWLRWVNHNGIAVSEREVKAETFNKGNFYPYIHPYSALYNREIYLSLLPFTNKGAPAIDNMRDAKAKEIEVRSFCLDSYVKHLVAGTRRMWGGHWFPGDRPPTSKWEKDKPYPI